MAKFPMDLSRFKKVSQDEHTTTLKHPHGHEIRIAHSKLDKKMRDQLGAIPMADGGAVKQGWGTTPSYGRDPKQFKESGAAAKESMAKEANDSSVEDKVKDAYDKTKEALGFAKGGKVAHYADGTPETPVSQADAAQPDASPTPQAPVTINIGGQPTPPPAPSDQPPGQWANGIPYGVGNAIRGSIGDVANAFKSVGAPIAEGAKGLIGGLAGTNPTESPVVPSVPNPGLPSAQAEAAQAPKAPETPQAPSDPYGTAATAQNYQQGLAEQKAGIFKEANALGKEGRAEARASENSAEQQQDAIDTYKSNFDALTKERAAALKDYQDGHIDPQRYMSTMGTFDRIRTGIGLLLGGMGAGVLHQENPVLQYINTQISNDIDAQKAELGKHHNLLAAAMTQFGNIKDASEMVRLMQMDLVSQQLKAAASRNQDPIAQARALQAAGKIDMEAAPIMGQIAMRKTLLNGAAKGQIPPERVVMAIVPKDQQPAAYKELGEAQGMAKARDNLLGAFEKLAQINTVGNFATSPIQTQKQVDALIGPLLAGLSKETAGRFTESDSKMLGGLFPAKGDNEETLKTKRIQMTKLITEKMNFPLLKTYGIDPSNFGRFNNQGQSPFQVAPAVKK